MGYDKIHGNAVMTVTYTLTCKHRKQCSGVYTYVEHTYIYISYHDMATSFYPPATAHPSVENLSIHLSALSEEM